MTGARRKLLLTAHVACSVGWLGTVVASLALGIAGIASDSPSTARSAYIALEVVGWSAVLPLSVASLVTGILQSLATPWGLLRHYWIVSKLALNVLAIAVLLVYMQTLGKLADGARTAAEPDANASPVVHGALALALLVVATALSIYKPRGLTKRGMRLEVRA